MMLGSSEGRGASYQESLLTGRIEIEIEIARAALTCVKDLVLGPCLTIGLDPNE